MNLREWISNCSEFLNLLPESDIVRGSIVKIFGIPWNYEEDYLQVSGFSSNQVDIPPTKRGVLKILAKIFDPLGLVTPVTFFGKVFLQELWKEGISWDELLSDNLCVKWKEILHKLKFLSRLKIPKFVGYVEVAKQYSLLVFCDASIKAYATAIYLRIEEQNSVNVNLMFSKMRLVSRGTNKKRLKKDITLPRLELFAVTIGIRATNFVASELKITSLKRVLWTDSTCVLHWLKPVNHCHCLLRIESKKY